MLSSSLEKCLVCMYQMLESDKELKISDLAKQMNQPLKMTEQGKSTAEYLIARDALIDEFLSFLHIEKNFATEKEAMSQYLSYESLEQIEKFMIFNTQYPEIAERFAMLIKMTPKHTLLPPLPNMEKKL